jgi:hypothetical protein
MADSPCGTTVREADGPKHFRMKGSPMRESFAIRLRAARGDAGPPDGLDPQEFRCGSVFFCRLSVGAIDGFLCDVRGREGSKSRVFHIPPPPFLAGEGAYAAFGGSGAAGSGTDADQMSYPPGRIHRSSGRGLSVFSSSSGST